MAGFWRWFTFLLGVQTSAVLSLSIDASETSLILNDSRTGLMAHTLFVQEATNAFVDGLAWTKGSNETTNAFFRYQTLLNGEKVHEGYFSLPEDPLDLPSAINVGTIFASKIGKTTVEIEFWVDETVSDSVKIEIQAMHKWMASIPMMVIIVLGLFARFHVVYSLIIGMFFGGCMVTGSFIDGFKSIITRYLISVASDEQHVYIYTFSLCVAGLAAMIRRSGGISSLIHRLSKYSKSILIGQLIVVGAGIFLFFDPYASIIIIGELLSSFFRLFPVSLEKYAFLIHATAVPVSSIIPVSTSIGFGCALIQSQLDELAERYDTLTIPEDSWTVFVRSVKYQYYPIFFLVLVPMMVITRRDIGPMLITERRRWLFTRSGQVARWPLREKISRPDDDTPRLDRNLWIPLLFWNAAIWTAVALVNDPASEDNAIDFMAALIYCTIGTAALTQIFYAVQSKSNGKLDFRPYNCIKCFWEREAVDEEEAETIRNAESHLATIKSDGRSRRLSMRSNAEERSVGSRRLSVRSNADERSADFILNSLEVVSSEEETRLHTLEPPTDRNDHTKLMHREPGDSDEIEATLQRGLRPSTDDTTTENHKVLVSLKDGAQCFFKGGAAVTPTLMTLTLAWATTEVFLVLGMDRLFADLINGGNLDFNMYPAVAFIVSALLALSTGSPTTAQAIVLPLMAIPLYEGTGGNIDLFYSLVGAIFSGSALGDHASPISASTILSTFTIECDLKNHIFTQAPCIFVVALLSLLVGHLPVGFESYPYYIGYGIGVFLLTCFVYFLCEDVLHKEGKYDFITECYLAKIKNRRLQDLKTHMCIVHGIKMAKNAQNNDLLLDTDSTSTPPSMNMHEEASQTIAQEKGESEISIEDPLYDRRSDDESSTSSYSQRRRRPPSPPVRNRDESGIPAGPRSPSRSEKSRSSHSSRSGHMKATRTLSPISGIRGNPSSKTQQTNHLAARPDIIVKSKSPNEARNSEKNLKAALSPNVRAALSPTTTARQHSSFGRETERARVPTSRDRLPRTTIDSRGLSPRDILDDTGSALSRDLIRPPGVEQIASSGEEGSFDEGGATAVYSEYYDNDTAYGSGSLGTDADSISHATGMRTRVMRWLGNAIDGGDEATYSSNNGRDTRKETIRRDTRKKTAPMPSGRPPNWHY